MIKNPAEKVNIKADAVYIDGELMVYRREVWIMLNKPAGYLSATEDGRGPVVLDLISPEPRKLNLFPVGRLDKDSEGLLLLTNDGQTAHHLLSPKYHVEKIYNIQVSGVLTEDDIKKLRSGEIRLDGKPCLPADLEILNIGETREIKNQTPSDGQTRGAWSEARLILREGRYHQAKRMLAALGKPVFYLKRLQMGNIKLDPSLKPGQFRYLTDDEINSLRG